MIVLMRRLAECWPYYLRDLSASGVRYVLRLRRVARRLESAEFADRRVPGRGHLRYSDVADGVWRTIARRDDGRDGHAWVSLALRLVDGKPAPIDLPPVPDLPDPRPGHYYVSAIDGPDRYLVAGPWPTHWQALVRVAEVRALAEQRDGSGKAAFMAWGTARSDEPLPSILGDLSAPAQPATPPINRRRGQLAREV